MKTKWGVLGIVAAASLVLFVGRASAGTTLEMGKYFQVLPPVYEPHDPPNGLYNGPGVAAVGWLNIVTYEESGNPRDQNINHVMERSCCTGLFYGADQYVTFKFGRVPGDFNLYSVDLETASHVGVGNDLSLSYSFDNVNWTTIGTGGYYATITGTVDVGAEDSLYVRTWLYGDYGGVFWTMIADWTVTGYNEIGALKARVAALESAIDTIGGILDDHADGIEDNAGAILGLNGRVADLEALADALEEGGQVYQNMLDIQMILSALRRPGASGISGKGSIKP